jgi:glucans biosynthesis protein
MLRGILLNAGAALPERAVSAQVQVAEPTSQITPFDSSTVRAIARQLALKPYKAADRKLPTPFEALDFDAYQGIRFDPSRSLWRGQGRRFTAQFFHRGYIYHDRVSLFEVTDGIAAPIK